MSGQKRLLPAAPGRATLSAPATAKENAAVNFGGAIELANLSSSTRASNMRRKALQYASPTRKHRQPAGLEHRLNHAEFYPVPARARNDSFRAGIAGFARGTNIRVFDRPSGGLNARIASPQAPTKREPSLCKIEPNINRVIASPFLMLTTRQNGT